MAPPVPQDFPVPQHVYQAQAQLTAELERVEGKPVDLLKAPWAEVEKSIIKLLGGAVPGEPAGAPDAGAGDLLGRSRRA